MSTLELIFAGISAFSAAVTAWAAGMSRKAGAPPGAEARRRPKSTKERRRTRTLLLGIASAAAAAVTVFLVVSALDDDSEPKEAPLLRAVVPTTFSRSCVPENPPEGAVASLACTPSPRIASAHYALFNSRAALNRAFQQEVAELALPEGNCERNGFAVDPYGTAGEGNWGRLLCYVDDDASHISWTNQSLRILATAVAPLAEDNELYIWWENEGGPLPTSNLKTFPTKAEAELLDWIPGAYRGRCKRSSWGGRSAKASVLCHPTGVDVLGYSSYESLTEMRKAFETRLGTPQADETPPCSSKGRAGDSSYRLGTERGGRLVCYVTNQVAYYEWTYDNAWVTAYARRDDGDMTKLFGWWRRADFPG